MFKRLPFSLGMNYLHLCQKSVVLMCCVLSHLVVSNCLQLWTVAHQGPLSMGFFRQESWSGLSCPTPGGLPNPVNEPWFLTLQADSLPSEPYVCVCVCVCVCVFLDSLILLT